jgi:ribosomal-protein-alanine N-acetyltransferase
MRRQRQALTLRIPAVQEAQALQVLIRPDEPQDFETLLRIDQECFPPRVAYSRRTLRAFLRLPGVFCLVAEHNAEIAGFILAYGESGEGHIITLDVREPFRHRGVGSRLLRSAETSLAARGVRCIELETATNNRAAIAFWEKHGYRAFGVAPGYYADGSDAYLMRKMILPEKERPRE